MVLSFWYSACVHDPILPPDDPTIPIDTSKAPSNPNPAIVCDSQKIYFNRDILPIFQNSCAISGCHDARTGSDGYFFTDYQNIVKKGFTSGRPGNSKVYEVITATRARDMMPPAPYSPLSSTQIGTIRRWIEEGLRNDSCSQQMICDTLTVSFSKSILPLFQSQCTACHGPLLSYAGIKLHTYPDVKNAVAEGRLLGSIRWENGYTRMPLDRNQLQACDIKKIEIWIRNQSPNN
jgi:hypothetical protein